MLDTDKMTDAERKAYANKLAMVQEEICVAREKKRGNLAWRIAREYDVLVVTKSGETWIIDCKRSDNGIFDIEVGDVNKLLNSVIAWQKHQPNVVVRAKFEMWFSRTRQFNNKRYVDVTEADRGWTIQCTKTPKKITTKIVQRGRQEQRQETGEYISLEIDNDAVAFLKCYLRGARGKDS